jgi:hypothetical protein
LDVRLLEPGAEPRSVLRELPETPGAERRAASLILSGEQRQGQFIGKTATPPVLLELELERSASWDDRMTLTYAGSPFTLGADPLAEPQAALAMMSALDGTSGFSGSARIDRSLGLADFSFKHPDSGNVQAQQLVAAYAQTLAQLAVRFPHEPIGPGARWTWTSRHRTTLGAEVIQDNSATLESSGERVRVRMESSFRADRQRISGAPLPETVSFDVTSVSGAGSARVSFEAGELLPIEADATAHWELLMIADHDRGADEVTMTQDMSLELDRP